MQPTDTKGKAFDRVGISVFTSFKAGVPVKVVSERLGHANPAFTMSVYRHVLPGMQAEAAANFAKLLGEGDEPINDNDEEGTSDEHPDDDGGPGDNRRDDSA